MAVETTAAIMEQGSWSVDLDWRADIYDELVDTTAGKPRPRKVHVLIYDPDSALAYCGVLLRIEGDEKGLRIGGHGSVWWLGQLGGPGPLIVDREFVSGNNKLSNDITAPAIASFDTLYWRYAEGTFWVLTPSNVFHANPTFAEVSEDDVLQSDETFEVEPGQLHTAEASVFSGGFTFGGRIRVRRVYEGRFATPDLAIPLADWSASVVGDIATTTDPLALVTGDVFSVHSSAANRIPNGQFDDGGAPNLNGWFNSVGHWFVDNVNGSWDTSLGHLSTDLGGGAPGYKYIQSSATGTLPIVHEPVTEGEEYELRLVVRPSPSFAAGVTDGEIYLEVGEVNASFTTIAYESTDHFTADANSDTNWRILLKRFTVQPGVVGLIPNIIVKGHTAGQWDIDSATVVRTGGNVDARTGDGIIVVPRRTYDWSLPFRSDAGTQGTVQMRMVCYAADRPNVILQGPTLSATDGEKQVVSWSVQTPSGYDFVQQQIYAADVAEGTYYLGQGTMVDTDPTTTVRDGLSGNAAAHALGGDVISYGAAPDGAERLRVELVAENLAGEWAVSGVSLTRVGVTPSTSAAVAAALLVDQDTGSQLLTAGTITGVEVIPFDWRVRNLNLRDALDHLCNAVAEPRREYRVNPDRSFDFGTAAQISTDHSATDAVVVLPRDRDVDPLPAISADASDRPTIVRVIGAERRMANGTTVPLAASATVPGTAETDWNGFAVTRTQLVADGTLDHVGYVQAVAADEAARLGDAPLSATLKLSGLNVRPAMREGDWIALYHPKGGISDPTNPVDIDGETVFPQRVRIIQIERECGPAWSVVIRRTDGTMFDLPGVIPSTEDSTTLTIGERALDDITDPQGGVAANQYLRDRASRPR